MRTLQPPGWPRPRGYANGIAARGTMVFVAGQIGWDERQAIVSDDLALQLGQALDNTLAVLREAGAGPEHVVRMTWYLTDKRDYLARARELGEVWRDAHGPALPGDGRGRGERPDRGARQDRDRDHCDHTRPRSAGSALTAALRHAAAGETGPTRFRLTHFSASTRISAAAATSTIRHQERSETGRVSNSTCIGGA